MPTATSGASRRGEEPPDQRQTGLCSMQRPVILSSGLPPDLPDGFIRLPYRPSDRPTLPTALPEALAGRVTWVILTAHLTDGFRQPDFSTSRPPDFSERPTDQPYRQPYRQVSFQRPDRPASPAARPAASPASHTSQPDRPARPTSPTSQPDRPARPASPTDQPDRQPHRPATPASPTDQPDQQPHRPSTPAINTGHPHPPSSPAKVPPACLNGRLRSAGRRLRGWRSSRHG